MTSEPVAMVGLLRQAGFIGLAIFVIAVALLVASILVLILARSRRAAMILLLLAVLPLLLGVLGTLYGRVVVVRTVEASGGSPARQAQLIDQGHRQAWVPTYLGGGATVVLEVLALVALSVKGRPAGQAKAAARPR